MRPGVAWAAALAIVAAACTVSALTPTSHLIYSTDAVRMPFEVPMTIGEPARGRTIEVTVERVRGAGELETALGETEGRWVVIDLVADSRGVDPDTTLEMLELEVRGATYTASSRVDGTLDQAPLRAGLPVRGSLVFELPAEAAHGTAQLRIGSVGEPRLDDFLALRVDLDGLDFSARETVDPWGWAS